MLMRYGDSINLNKFNIILCSNIARVNNKYLMKVMIQYAYTPSTYF